MFDSAKRKRSFRARLHARFSTSESRGARSFHPLAIPALPVQALAKASPHGLPHGGGAVVLFALAVDFVFYLGSFERYNIADAILEPACCPSTT